MRIALVGGATAHVPEAFFLCAGEEGHTPEQYACNVIVSHVARKDRGTERLRRALSHKRRELRGAPSSARPRRPNLNLCKHPSPCWWRLRPPARIMLISSGVVYEFVLTVAESGVGLGEKFAEGAW